MVLVLKLTKIYGYLHFHGFIPGIRETKLFLQKQTER